MRSAHVHRSVALLLLAAGSAVAQVQIPSPLQPAPGLAPAAGLRLSLDAGLLAAAAEAGEFTLVGLPTERGPIDLLLSRFEVLTPDAQRLVMTGDHAAPLPAPDVVLFRGEVVGEAGSGVFLALSPDGANGFIRSEAGSLILAGAGANETYIYAMDRLGDFARVAPFCAGAIEPPLQDALIAGATGGGEPETTTCRTMRVAVETDWEYFNLARLRNVARAQNYAITLFGAVSEIFRRDVNVIITVPFLRIWSTNTDPYVTSTMGARLDEFRNHWNATQGGVDREVVHMLSGSNLGGGVAYLSVLCNRDWGYAINADLNGTFPLPVQDNNGQNWDLVVTAHELGHNFAAPHTHDMTPQVDGCGTGNCADAALGTIMSYCHTCAGGLANVRLSLQERVISERILPYINALNMRQCGPRYSPVQITQPPSPTTARVGGSAVLSVGASGGGNVRYQWRRNGLIIRDNQCCSAVFQGTTTPTLTISNLALADSGDFTVDISNECGGVTTQPARLSVYCRADANTDGEVDLADFFEFFQCWDTTAACADIDSEPGVDLADFFLFFQSYDLGC